MARCWIGAHDGDKILAGVANKKIRIERWERGVIQDVVSPRSAEFPAGRDGGTEVVVLGAGEERVLSSVGLCPDEGLRGHVGDRVKRNWIEGIGDGDETEVEVESVDNMMKFPAM